MTNANWLVGGDQITRAALDTALGLDPHRIETKPSAAEPTPRQRH